MYLELGEGVRVISKAEGVEGATGVQGVQALNAWALAVCAVCLSTAHEDHLQPSPADQPLLSRRAEIAARGQQACQGLEDRCAIR